VADYLLKPIHEDRVTECLARIQQRLGQTAPRSVPDRIVARSKQGLVLFARGEVWAFEAAERLMFVDTARGRFDIDLSLAAIEVSPGSVLDIAHHVRGRRRKATKNIIGKPVDGATFFGRDRELRAANQASWQRELNACH
jgi:hypothetical protein